MQVWNGIENEYLRISRGSEREANKFCLFKMRHLAVFKITRFEMQIR